MADITDKVVSLLGTPQQFSGGAALTAESGLTAAATPVAVAAAALTAESTLSVTATGFFYVSAGLSAESVLSADATGVYKATSAMSAQSSMTAAATLVGLSASIIVGTSDMTVTATLVQPAASSLTAESDLHASGGLIVNAGTAELVAEATLSAAGTYVQLAAASMDASLSTAADTMPIYRLTLPQVEYAYTNNILLSRYPIHVGQSLLISDGVGEIVEIPGVEQTNLADFYFAGGHQHQLNQNEYEAVVSAGFGDLVEVA